MASMKRPRLKGVQPKSDTSLGVTFTSGQHFTLDMSDALKTYPGLAPLSKPKAFKGVALGDGGWSVEWPALDIQIGADTLLLDALAQNAPDENTRVFIRWRLRHRMTLDQAAEALGVSARSISRYSSGLKPYRARWRWLAWAGSICGCAMAEPLPVKTCGTRSRTNQ